VHSSSLIGKNLACCATFVTMWLPRRSCVRSATSRPTGAREFKQISGTGPRRGYVARVKMAPLTTKDHGP